MQSQIERSLRDGRSISPTPAREPLKVAVPRLSAYHPKTGIGRVFHNLATHWGARVALCDAPLKAHRLPLLRNFPFGVTVPSGAELLLLPKLTGTEMLCGVQGAQGIPSVVIVHDVGVVDFAGDRASVNWLTHQMVMRSFRALPAASHVVAVSTFTKDRLLYYLPELEGRVSVVSNGVSDTFFDHRGTREGARYRLEPLLGRALNCPLLLYVGSEIPRKNTALLLEVFKRVKARYPDAKLLKVGTAGGERWRAETLRELTRLKLSFGEDVLLLEDVDDVVLGDAYVAADVFVSTSLYEGFGLPALEALAVGTPVVVSKCAALAEVVGGAGDVVPPEPEAFTHAVSKMLDAGPSPQRVLRGRSQAALYRWRDAATSYLDLMENLR